MQMQTFLLENADMLGLKAGQIELLTSSMTTTVTWVLRLAPGIFLTMFISIALFAFLGAGEIGSRFSAMLPRSKPLYLWRLPELWLIPLGLSLLFVLLGNPILKIIGENAMVFLVHLYAFFGICLVDYYFKGFSISAPIRLTIYLLAALVLVFVIPALAVLALIDSRVDFRKVSFSEGK
jgi:uncharacterized protein YybS (DUF2232 family)